MNLSYENLLALLAVMGTGLTVWIAWKKLVPEMKKLEVETSETNIKGAALVADKALELLQQMEQTLQAEKARMVEREEGLAGRVVALQEEISDLLDDLQTLKNTLAEKDYELHEFMKYIRQCIRVINLLLLGYNELGVEPPTIPLVNFENEN